MVKRIGGNRRKSRAKLRKPVDKRGKISIRRFFQELTDGERVQLLAEPAVQTGLYHLDFHGKSGIVSGKQGECYKVTIKDGKKEKVLIVHPVHLKKMA